MTRNVILIGSGPAGLTAAIYTARANLNPMVFEGSVTAGGQLMLTTEVENFPGFAKGILGPELMGQMREQAARFGAELITDDVTRVDFSSRPFRVWQGDTEHRAETVIIATGASAKLMGLPSEMKYMGHGVTTCATCDGAFYRGREVCVIGGGDSAMEEANFLTRFATKVTLIHRRRDLRASKIMQDRCRANPKIAWELNQTPVDVLGDGSKVTGIRIQDTDTQKPRDLKLDGVFVAIGHKPNTDLFKSQIDLHEDGYMKVKPGTVDTNIPGVFACGDVMDKRWRQAITAAGTGCMAALSAERFLEGHEPEH